MISQTNQYDKNKDLIEKQNEITMKAEKTNRRWRYLKWQKI